MQHIRFTFPLPIPESGDAPTEFRIWKWGENKTLKGSVYLDAGSAAAVVAAYTEHGIDLAIDYEHDTFNEEVTGPKPAAGWFRPEVRDDGLWATAVRWTERAAGMLKAKEYRYFSPVAHLDAKTRKPVRLMPMALTNWPASKDQEPLVARADEHTENTMKTVLVALGLKAEADESDALGALTALKLRADRADVLEADLGKANAELTKLKSDQVADAKKALIDNAIENLGVAPAKRGELEALELSALKVCLSLLPKIAEPARPPAEGDGTIPADTGGFSKEQLKMFRLTGMTPEKFLEHKKVLAQIVNPTEEN